MSYRLILKEITNEVTRDVGENIFLDQIPDDYKVYTLYYPGSMPDKNLEDHLRNLGNMTGKNLYINIGRLNDPNYNKIRNKFQIKNLPVIIITAIEGLASIKTETYFSTAYVKIDNKHLINSVDLILKCIERVFNLFIGGAISEALKQVRHDYRDAIVTELRGIMTNALKGIGEYISDMDITISIIEGKFELKHTGTKK
jgi:hypothetical protein